MKTNRLVLTIAMSFIVAFGNISFAQAGKKSDMRVSYVLENMGIKRDVQEKLRPLLVSYLADKKNANKSYDSLKEKLKPSINAGTITEKQAQQLLTLKWEAAEKELAVKREYETKFKTVISAKKTYICFDLLNDKKSKFMGENGKKGDLDD